MACKVTSPQEFFGFTPGDDFKMIHWHKLVEYYKLVDAQSDRVYLENMGKTSEGDEFYHIVISSEENIKNLDYYLDIARKLSDPTGLSTSEIEQLVKNGKAVCMQSYGLHSNEVGGPQMCPLLLFDLVTAEDGELYDILQNVIFVMVPCAEPDGEIVFTNWYNKYLGTEYEGVCSRFLRHRWAGHSNNRDAIHETVVESKHLNDLLLRRYFPQAYQDHHHQCNHEDRMCIAPLGGVVPATTHPQVYRETSFYGAAMAQALEEAGRTGVTSGVPTFTGYPITTFYTMANLHNIAGLLTESADAMIASPVRIDLDQRIGRGHLNQDVDINCPNPWKGGEWHLCDIVEQMYIASRSLLATMATNRAAVLRHMAQKAIGQTERGANSKEQAFLIPLLQHDGSARRHLLEILDKQGIKMKTATQDFVCDGRFYQKGTVIVPLAQPKYSAIFGILSPETNPLRKFNDASTGEDGYFAWFSKYMGVDVFAANQAVTVNTEDFYMPAADLSFPLSGRENGSFSAANVMLKDKKQLFRDQNGDFFENDGDGRCEVKAARIGLLTLSETYNEEEGFCRNLLHTFNFPYRDIFDYEIRERVPDDIDVLIISGYSMAFLSGGDAPPRGKPAECQSGLGTMGAKNLEAFVRGGGRVIAWEQSCSYIIRTFALPIAEVRNPEFKAHQSIIRIDTQNDPLCRGVAENVPVYFRYCPILNVCTYNWCQTNKWSVPAIFPKKKDLLINGRIDAPEALEYTPAIIRVPMGDGEIVLYTFDPKFRMQTDATYKLLFNALYL